VPPEDFHKDHGPMPRNTAAVVALALAVAACSQGSTNTAPATIAANTVAPPSPTEIYNLRERCAKDAVEAMKGFPKNSPQHISTYRDHYDLATNDCYMLTYTVHNGANDSILSSVSEGRIIGVFLETKPGAIQKCWVLERECTSEDEFDAMVQRYMGPGRP
jgi:hypothetical protein